MPKLDAVFSLWRTVMSETLHLIRARYLGSKLGALWLLLNPLIMAAIYTFIMSSVFKMKMGDGTSTYEYPVYLLIGVACFASISDSLSQSISSITGNSSLVKNMTFPMAVLPMSATLSTSFALLTAIAIAGVMSFVTGGSLGWMILLAPVWMALQYFVLFGLGFFLASYGVFTRDIQHALPPIMTVLMFASPVFYTYEQVPENFRFIWAVNPLYHLLSGYRSLIMYNRLPNPLSALVLACLGMLFLMVGLAVFNRTKPYFAEKL